MEAGTLTKETVTQVLQRAIDEELKKKDKEYKYFGKNFKKKISIAQIESMGISKLVDKLLTEVFSNLNEKDALEFIYMNIKHGIREDLSNLMGDDFLFKAIDGLVNNHSIFPIGTSKNKNLQAIFPEKNLEETLLPV